MTDSIGNYRRYQMADSCVYEAIEYGDSTLLVKTICAPICSSIVGVYDAEGKKIRSIQYQEEAVFPYATIQDGQIIWEDQTEEILDEEEKK